jgi:hypothetical protein
MSEFISSRIFRLGHTWLSYSFRSSSSCALILTVYNGIGVERSAPHNFKRYLSVGRIVAVAGLQLSRSIKEERFQNEAHAAL